MALSTKSCRTLGNKRAANLLRMLMKIHLKIIESDAERNDFSIELKHLSASSGAQNQGVKHRRDLIKKLLEDYASRCLAQACEDPVDAIRQRMNQLGLKQRDLASFLGGKNRASEIPARRRPLTLTMIRALNHHLNIPAELLIREIPLQPGTTVGASRQEPI